MLYIFLFPLVSSRLLLPWSNPPLLLAFLQPRHRYSCHCFSFQLHLIPKSCLFLIPPRLQFMEYTTPHPPPSRRSQIKLFRKWYISNEYTHVKTTLCFIIPHFFPLFVCFLFIYFHFFGTYGIKYTETIWNIKIKCI